ncbi:ATP-binding protein, partial [Streptacidiphilus pinicola]|uniref:ATP-binding protein n=1 Tax=Streptacidiphilus pinicola TaxID=2219663 RepID=UPI001A9FB112
SDSLGAGAYPDGVWQIELAPLDDPRGVVDAAVGALGLRATHLGLGMSDSLGAGAGADGDGPLARLLEFCGPRTLLVVLDNCEHLVQAAAELAARLVAACPGVTVLATSREPLGVPGELVRPLEPLPEPTALRLLAERGAAARPGFDPADPAQDPEACAEICRRLDGLPLAIELAAARLRAMTPRQLADRLDRRFTLLTGGNRTDLPRQQTLRAVVDWSWELLEKSERTLLARLSVFAGGWTLDAAEAICADGDDRDDLPAEDVAPCLLSLVDKSLIQADLTADAPEPRYRMLETIHEYATERLRETDDPAAPALAHLRWFRELARTTDPLLRAADQLDALRLLDTEHDNLRAALRRAVEAGEEQEALSLLCNLGWYWMLRNQRDEARNWTRAVRALIPGDPLDVPAVPIAQGPCDLPPPWPGPVLEEARRVATMGVCLTAEGAFGGEPEEEVRRLGARLVEVYRPELPQSARLPALQRVYVVMFTGLLDQLQEVADGLVDGCRRFGRPWELACALQVRAKLLNDRPDVREQAARDASESLELFTGIGDRWGRAEAISGLAEIANFSGDFAEGVRCCREAMALAKELGADQEQPILRVRLGDALLGLGRVEEGEAELLGGIEDARAYGVVGQGAGMFGSMLLAGLRMRQQRLDEARELLENLLTGPFGEGVGSLLTGLVQGLLGGVDAMDGRPEQGLRRIRAGLREMRIHPLVPFTAEQLPLVLVPSLTGTLWRCAKAGVVPEERPAETAVTLLGAYDHLQSRSARHHLDLQAFEETSAGLRALLGDASYDAAYRAGAALDVRSAIALMDGE